MRTTLEIVATSLFSLVLSVNLLLYSSQRYYPPRAESLSFSILNCTSHQNQESLSEIVRLITGSADKENGSEKHRFCYSCCNPRNPLAIPALFLPKPKIQLLTFLRTSKEFVHTGELLQNLPIRSPPESWVQS